MQGSPDAKKPCKGILKTSSSFDKHSGTSFFSHRKSAKFDELNVLQTYHPPDKDYGHMKIEEPKTPYNYVDPDANTSDQLDAELLAEKLTVAANTRTSSFDDDSSGEEYDETDEEKSRRLTFEKRRKAHYNEFEAVRLARKLIEEEDDDDDDDVDDDQEDNKKKVGNTKKSDEEKKKSVNVNNPSGSGSGQHTKLMDIEEREQDPSNSLSSTDNLK